MAIGGINIPNLGNTFIQTVSGGTPSITGSGNIFVFSNGNNFTISGSGIPKNQVLIQSLLDLPIPVSNNITLDPNKIYRFGGNVDIGNNYFTLVGDTVLQGGAHRLDGIQSSYTGYLLNSNNVSVTVDNLKISTPSGLVFSILGTNTGRCDITTLQLSGCSGLGTISGLRTVMVQDCIVSNSDNGLLIIGPGALCRFSNNRFLNHRSINFTGFTFPSGTNTKIGNVDMIDSSLITELSTQTVLFIQSGAVATGLISACNFGGPGITLAGGLSKGDPDWKIEANRDFPNSTSIGCIRTSGNVTATPFPAQNQFISISGYSSTGALMERFRMSNSGTFQYYGNESFEGIAVFNGYITSPTATNISWGFAFTKNGVVITDAYFEVFTTATGVQTPITLNTAILLQTNDTLGISAANRTNTTSLTMPAYNFTVKE